VKRSVVIFIFALTGCATPPAVHPPQADVQALIEAKPKPTGAILTDPAASDRYNSAVESWGNRIHAAGVRLCQYYKAQGMDVTC